MPSRLATAAAVADVVGTSFLLGAVTYTLIFATACLDTRGGSSSADPAPATAPAAAPSGGGSRDSEGGAGAAAAVGAEEVVTGPAAGDQEGGDGPGGSEGPGNSEGEGEDGLEDRVFGRWVQDWGWLWWV
ncbi:hypothetical protein NEMBOFW57_001985 [Staphylotrichum longicolle]|uniref:Uncharacterized protein n=1 Tax=Staphylotrichum longicolle TaxID=669026 RepID=A0AAD4F274_9PEZI|nr:hypothetical protein NEMBOFW57_001985 [Staphylotrichum longicolle]